MRGLATPAVWRAPVEGARGRLRDGLRYRRDRLRFFSELAAGDEAVRRCRIGGRGYLLSDPLDIEHVLRGNAGAYQRARRLAGLRPTWKERPSLYVSTDASHRRRRRLLQPILHSHTARLTRAALENARRLGRRLDEGESLDLRAATSELARASMLQTVVAAGRDSLREALVAGALARKRFMERLFFSAAPLPELGPGPINLRYLRAMRRAHAAIDAEVEARRTSGERPDDLLSALIDAEDVDGTQLGAAEVRNEVMTLALTGYESVGEAIAWTLILLDRHPEVGARVDDELAGEPPGGATLKALPLTGAVVRESLRLYPPTWIFGRVAQHDDRLPSGRPVVAGSKLLVCPFTLHRDPVLWPEPVRFDPSRFLDPAADDRPRFSYLPFGAGPRVCIGQRMALAELLAALAGLLRDRRISVERGSSPAPQPGLTLAPPLGTRLRATPA